MKLVEKITKKIAVHEGFSFSGVSKKYGNILKTTRDALSAVVQTLEKEIEDTNSKDYNKFIATKMHQVDKLLHEIDLAVIDNNKNSKDYKW